MWPHLFGIAWKVPHTWHKPPESIDVQLSWICDNFSLLTLLRCVPHALLLRHCMTPNTYYLLLNAQRPMKGVQSKSPDRLIAFSTHCCQRSTICLSKPTSQQFVFLSSRCTLLAANGKKMPMWNMMNVAVSNRVALYRVNITNTHKQAYRIAMTCVVWWMCFRLACRNICVQSINWARAPLLDHIARLGTLDKGDARSLGYPIDTNRSGWTSHFVFASGPDRIACNFVLRTNSTATQNELLFHFLLALLNLGRDTRYLWLFCCVFMCIKWWLIFSFNPNQRFADCYLPNAHLAAFEYNIPILCIMFSSQFLHIFFSCYVMLCESIFPKWNLLCSIVCICISPAMDIVIINMYLWFVCLHGECQFTHVRQSLMWFSSNREHRKR